MRRSAAVTVFSDIGRFAETCTREQVLPPAGEWSQFVQYLNCLWRQWHDVFSPRLHLVCRDAPDITLDLGPLCVPDLSPGRANVSIDHLRAKPSDEPTLVSVYCPHQAGYVVHFLSTWRNALSCMLTDASSPMSDVGLRFISPTATA